MLHFAKIALSLSLVPVVCAPQAAFAEDAVQTASMTSVAAPGTGIAIAADFKGKMLYSASGDRLAAIYRVGADGAAQIILNGKMINVPASSLSAAEGKLTTSLSRKDLLTAH